MFHRESTKVDEFSFPIIEVDPDPLHQLPYPQFATSPLWSASSVAHNEKKTGHQPRRSFPSVLIRETETRNNELRDDMFTVDEEKMDKLWEDFNEELSLMSCNLMSDSSRTDAAVDNIQHGTESSSMIHRRKPILLLMLKVLKKLFLVRRTAASKRVSLCKV